MAPRQTLTPGQRTILLMFGYTSHTEQTEVWEQYGPGDNSGAYVPMNVHSVKLNDEPIDDVAKTLPGLKTLVDIAYVLEETGMTLEEALERAKRYARF